MVALRYFNVFGPRQDPHSDYAAVVPKFIRQMLAGKSPTIYGDGRAARDFTHVANVVDATIAAADAPNAAGLTINVATGTSHTLRELVATLNELMATDLEPVHLDARPGEVTVSRADVSLAHETLGYEPAVAWEDGLRRTIDWITSTTSADSAAP
jgi:UDP-N-acetylglucosamine/UDP-N-acetyl-alpha-D-glucosaminouronate 4-epimerase